MRRRHQRSPQNHALVASVAGVILLCGVVSVQTTQASQAFSHEQGMARMAAPQGSDAGATTAGDATWWSFWRAVRTLPHAYDAATATVLGAGDRGHASLDRALAEKRAEIERLRAQTASLKAEQARILAGAKARAAAVPAAPRRPPPAAPAAPAGGPRAPAAAGRRSSPRRPAPPAAEAPPRRAPPGGSPAACGARAPRRRQAAPRAAAERGRRLLSCCKGQGRQQGRRRGRRVDVVEVRLRPGRRRRGGLRGDAGEYTGHH